MLTCITYVPPITEGKLEIRKRFILEKPNRFCTNEYPHFVFFFTYKIVTDV